jgi:hypothetical protein
MTIRRVNRGKAHQYWDGDRQLPGVTTIINSGLPKPALINWAAETTAGYAVDHWDELADLTPSARLKLLTKARWETSKAAIARGTEIHAAAEMLHQGVSVQLDDALVGPVEAYARLLDQWKINATWIETPVVNRKHWYAGTLDLIATVNDTHTALIDVKTGKGVFPETALQLAAYRYAETILDGDHEVAMPQVDTVYVAHVMPDAAELVPVEAGPEQFRAFLYVAQVAKWQQSADQLIGSPLRPDPPRLEVVQ